MNAFLAWLVRGDMSPILYLFLSITGLSVTGYLFFEVEDHGFEFGWIDPWSIVVPVALYVYVVVPSLAIYKSLHDPDSRRDILGIVPLYAVAGIATLLACGWAVLPEYLFVSYVFLFLSLSCMVALVYKLFKIVQRFRKREQKSIEEEEDEPEVSMIELPLVEEEEPPPPPPTKSPFPKFDTDALV